MSDGEMPAARGESSGGAASWVVLSRMSVQAFQLVLLLVATRYLSVAEFGLFALLQAIVLGGVRIAFVGWRDFLIREEDPLLRRKAFGLSILFGLALSALWASGGLVAFLAGAMTAEATTLLVILTSTIFLTSLNSAQAGDLIRRQRVARHAQVQIVSEAAGLAVAIGSLVSGLGIYALVMGRVTTSLVMNAGYPIAGALIRPSRPDRRSVREVYLFIRVFFVSSLMDFLRQNAAVLMIGAFLGLFEVGLYRAASRIIGAVVEVGAETVRLISWQGLLADIRQKRDEDFDIGDRIRQRLGMVVLLAAPVFFGIAAIAGPMIDVILGAKWAGAVPVVEVLAISGLFIICSSGTVPILVALRRQNLVLTLSPIALAINLAAVFIGLQFGLLGAAIGQAVGWVLSSLVYLAAQHRVAPYSRRAALRDAAVPMLGALAMVLAVREIGPLLPIDVSALSLAAYVALGGIAYLGVLVLLARSRLLAVARSFSRR